MKRISKKPYPGFIIAAVLMLIAFASISFPEWYISRDWGAIGQSSALQLALEPIYFGGIMLMFPFAACTVHAPLQVEEIQTGFFWERLIRTSTMRYGLCQIGKNFVSSWLCFFLTFLLHAAFCHILALPSMPEIYDAHEIPYAPDCIYAAWLPIAHGLPIILWTASMLGMSSGVWATLGLAVSVWIPDRLLTISIPTFIYYIFASQTVFRFAGRIIPHPSDIYNDALTADMLVMSLVYYLILFIAFAAIYFIGLQRRRSA